MLAILINDIGMQPLQVLFPEDPVPFVDAGPGGGLRILRVEGKEQHALDPCIHQLRDGIFGEGSPIPHGNDHSCVDARPEGSLQSGSLALCVLQNRGPSADPAVHFSHFSSPRPRDQSRERLPEEERERKVDDVRITEEVLQEGFHAVERIRAAELQEDDSHRT